MNSRVRNSRVHHAAQWLLLLAATTAAAQEVFVDAGVPIVTVTGSRIPRASDDTLEPTTVIDSDYIESRGLTNIADALNESPGFGTGTTPEGDQSTFGPGLNFVNRFGLGSNRTLTLVNGRRFVSSNVPALFGPAAPGNQVDLNFIPTILLDRVENLSVGGAPTYGSDAIAGVVNVKLKKDFQGFRAFGQYGQLEDGHMPNESIGLVGGFNFADGRGNLTASVQHSETDGVRASDNDRFARGYFYGANPNISVTATQPARTPANDGRVHTDVPFNTGNADGIPNAVLVPNRRRMTMNFGGVALPTGATSQSDGRLRCFGATSSNCLQFAPDGRLVPFDTGINFGTSDATGGDGLNLVDTLQLVSDLDRTSGTLSAHFDIDEHVELFTDLFAYDAEAREIVDQTAYNSTNFGGSSGAITLPADHPLLTQQARDTLAGLGVTAFRLSRANRDLATNAAHSKSNLYQGVVGARGGFDAGDRGYDWEVSFDFGRNDTTFYSTQLNRQRFVNALNVVSSGGQLVCSPTPNYSGLPPANAGRVLVGSDAPVADPACVPLDIFGEGRPSAAALAYVSSLEHTDADLEQQVINANIGSTLVDTWGGPILYNVGFEHRKESGRFEPDAYLQAGLGRSAASSPVAGSWSTNEFFSELLVPLVSDLNAVPGVHELTLTAKARRVDNSRNGKFTTWTGGLQWAPIRDLEFRGNVTRSLRAPSITELFTPVSPTFTSVQDPCSTQLISSGVRPAVRAANCARFFEQYGLPATGWQSNAVTSSVQGSTSGDAGIGNETSNAWAAGFVLRPRFLDGFDLAVDWVDIRVDHVITNLFADDLASACFDNSDYPNAYCDHFTRNPRGSADPGQITFVRTGFTNGAYQSMAALTAEAGYRHSFAGLGDVRIGLSWYRLREELRSITGVTVTNTLDQLGSPEDSVQLNLAWQRGPLGAHWQTNYVGSQVYNRTFNAESRDVLEVASATTHNFSMSYAASSAATVRLAVTNLFDAAPPFPIGVDAFNGNYDFLGRRYSLSFTYDFAE